MENLKFARVISGELFEHLKSMDIFGRVTESGYFVIYGCRNEDQQKFYQGLLNYDHKTDIQGWETIEEVKQWWEEDADMLLVVEEGCFEILDQLEDEK